MASNGPPTVLPTIRSRPLSRSLLRAFASRSSLSAAKPTRNGRRSSGISPTSATMSGFGTSSTCRPASRLILVADGRFGAKSATAAAMIRMSAAGAARSTASRMAAAVVASCTVTPRGAVTLMVPAIRVTLAPRSRAASAMATPILPLLRLPMKRTGSSGSRVPPALTTTCSPSRSPARAKRRSTASTMLDGSARRPTPVRPDASAPTSGSTMQCPKPRSVSTLRWVAGWVHMPGVHGRRHAPPGRGWRRRWR